MTRLRFILPCLGMLLATGCSSLLGSSRPTDIYTLDTAAAAAVAPAHRIDTGLAVEMPEASGLLDTPSLLVSPIPGQLQVYAGARWAERPAVLWRQRLLAALAAHGMDHAVPAESGALTPYSLEGSLDDFRAVVAQKRAHVRVVVQVRLIDNASRQLLAQRRFSAERPARSLHAAAFAAALAEASDAVASQVATWTLKQLPSKTASRSDD